MNIKSSTTSLKERRAQAYGVRYYWSNINPIKSKCQSLERD